VQVSDDPRVGTELAGYRIESLLGFALPDEARTHDDWWAGRGPDADAPGHADAWRLAGRTAKPNFHARTVSFERVST